MKKQYIKPNIAIIPLKQEKFLLTTSQESEPEVTGNIGSKETIFYEEEEKWDNTWGDLWQDYK